MKRPLIFFTLVLVTLNACQSVPAARKNNCVCAWETLGFDTEGPVA